MGSTTSQIVIFVYRILFISYCFKEAFSNKVFHVCLTCFISIFADQLNYVLVHILDKEFEFNLQYSHFSTVVYVALELILMLLFVALLKVYSKFFRNCNCFYPAHIHLLAEPDYKHESGCSSAPLSVEI